METKSRVKRLKSILVGLNAQRDWVKDYESDNLEKLKSIENDIVQYTATLKQHEDELKNKISKWDRPPVYYSDYLQLDSLLKCQLPESAKYGQEAHDEMLFIIIHQTYELWFKQILHELDEVVHLLNRDYIPERDVARMVHHLNRIVEVQKVLLSQLAVLKTMTPLDFLDFRDFLYPASGFQSYQFRLLENKLGLQSEKRIQYERTTYHSKLSTEHQKQVVEAEQEVSLFSALEKWLERTPFLEEQTESYNFLESYKKAGEEMFDQDKKIIDRNTNKSTQAERENQLKRLEENRNNFTALFDEKAHEEQIVGGTMRFSFKAMQAALLIHVYQDEPIFSLPWMLLQKLMDIDENFTMWRFSHATMVSRMIGSKIGTGGSSGHYYLKSTVERGRVFADIGNLATYLIPRKDLPKLPKSLQKAAGFFGEETRNNSK